MDLALVKFKTAQEACPGTVDRLTDRTQNDKGRKTPSTSKFNVPVTTRLWRRDLET